MVVAPVSARSTQALVDPTSDGPQQAAVRSSHRLVVELASPPLAAWLKASDAVRTANGRLDLASPEAKSYIEKLEAEQAAFVSEMKAAMPSAAVGEYLNEQGDKIALSYQVAFNGVTVETGNVDKDVARKTLARLPGVKAVHLDYAYDPDLYASVPLINAAAAYNNPVIGGMVNAGKGIKAASMDGGAHHAAAMFDGTGYSYPVGWPAGGLGLTANNNGKIIASRAYFRTWDPPSAGDENPWPGTLGTPHGTHTSSTMAGNQAVASFYGITQTVAGVAPAAWVMSYRVFYNSITNNGSFYLAEGLAALEDIAMDGADVLNNSWGGGPGSAGGEFDALDAALQNVAAAGTFVSMSNGNAGPNTGTSDHPSSDYINVAASQSGGTFAAGRLSVTAPTPISPTLQSIPFTTAAFGATFPPGSVNTFDYLPSAVVSPTNVLGCSPWPAGTFTGKAAMIQRGTCEFGVKVLNAERGGAIFVVVYNNTANGDTLTTMGAGAVGNQVTIPSVLIGNSRGTRMVTWYNLYGAASEVTLDNTAYQTGNTPDVIANFSSRGPGVGLTLKPDITAPGVNILAQGYGVGTGEARHLGFGQASGTSMASPHIAGSAALIRQIHPAWSNAYIKSALMSTSKYLGIYNADGTPAQPLDMGAGRVDLTHAADPGVILNPPSVGFGQVFTGTTTVKHVMVTSVGSATETYDLSTLKVSGAAFTYTPSTVLPGFSVSPSQITLAPGASTQITVTFDTAGTAIGDNQGFIVMDRAVYDAHFPVWGRVAPTPTGNVLIIDNDGSSSLGHLEYVGYYTRTLTTLGMTYDVLDTDASAGAASNFLPNAATLSSYKAIIYFTGDNFSWNGRFTVPTPLTARDMERLVEYANQGGVIFAMGQDLTSVLNSTGSSASFFYSSVLGGSYLQDSVTDENLPSLPVIPLPQAPKDMQGIALDLSVSASGDGADNQGYIDEIETEIYNDPPFPNNYYYPLMKYPGSFNVQDGTVAMAHREQPTLEKPGVSYFGRSIFTTFGLEGVNNGVTGATSREQLLTAFMKWATDAPAATIQNVTPLNASDLSMFRVTLTSNITTTTGVKYRWDFGDGTPFTTFSTSRTVGHTYAFCGTYEVRVEAVGSLGNSAIGTLTVPVSNCTTKLWFLPSILK